MKVIKAIIIPNCADKIWLFALKRQILLVLWWKDWSGKSWKSNTSFNNIATYLIIMARINSIDITLELKRTETDYFNYLQVIFLSVLFKLCHKMKFSTAMIQTLYLPDVRKCFLYQLSTVLKKLLK